MYVSDYVAKKYGRRIFPREMMMEGKIDELMTPDLLAVIIGSGTKNENVFSLSERIIRDYGSKAVAEIRDPKELSKLLNISSLQASKIIAVFEMGRRFFGEAAKKKTLIRGPEDIYKYASEMKNFSKEFFRGIYLNSKNIIIHDENISVGHLTASLVHPREVFKSAIECSASSIIVVHNHPSGDHAPSDNDDKITKMLKESGDILQIPLVDHLIISEIGYYSYNKERRI
ncbi:MAG: DNA repair protein RadC [Candidatus Delongbacteria bacterium]|nr:DNA repair protein RadC [Candidatus Delongbacteria bacterium]